MSIIPGRECKRRGSAMVTLMIVILLVSIAGAGMVGFAKQQANAVSRVRDYLKAQAYAEAGANAAYSVLKESFANASDPSKFQAQVLGDGGFDATVTPVGTEQASIVSVGTCGDATITVKCDVMNMGPSTPGGGAGGGAGPEPPGFDYAILVGGYASLRGCGILSSSGGAALLHANGVFDVRGNVSANLNVSSSTEISTGNVTIDGSTWAPSYSLHKKCVITGTKNTCAVPPVAIPDLDLTPYYNWALAHGEVHNGFTRTTDYTPNGGILWVNGDVHFSSWATVDGTIIATGDINMSGHVSVNAGSTGMALVSRDGDIQNTAGGTINGLIYCKTGNYRHTANGTTVGQIIVAGDLDKGGNSDVLTFSKAIPVPPSTGGGGGSGTSSDHVVITAWQQ